jgi:DNA-binding beta-propeller fold protein YncE
MRPSLLILVVLINNWDGTADVIDPNSFQKLARINIVPDKEQRLAEIQADPDHYAYFLAIRNQVGEGHDQFVDDMFSSHDGRFLYVSRPSLADVVAFDLRIAKIVWRFPVEGYRADHMAISPGGSRLLVSASTARKVHVIDTATGKSAGEFPSGDQPHENTYSRDGNLIYHASIGTVFTPTDDPALDDTKGERVFEVVDAHTLRVIKRLDMGQKLEEAGYPDMSSAVRPMALPPDERKLYFQVSFSATASCPSAATTASRSSPTPPNARSAACASATTRSGCGWVSWPRARSACGRAPASRRAVPAGPGRSCASPCARSACAPAARCACACG